MKKLAIIFIAIFGMTFAFQSVNAQVNSSTVSAAAAGAKIIAPITLTNPTALDFGNIIAGTGGTVIMTTGNARSSTGGVTLQEAVDGQAAIFNVTGLEDAAFSITLPSADCVLDDVPETSSMTIAWATFNHSAGATPAITGANFDFTVGATLTVGSGQTAGIYSGEYEVTVTYE